MLGYVVLPAFCLDFLTAEDGTDRLFRNVGEGFTNTRCVISQKGADHTYYYTESCRCIFHSADIRFAGDLCICQCDAGVDFSLWGYSYLQIG